MPKKAIFLDRDGVVNKEVNYLFKIEDFEFIDGIFDACLYFKNLGYDQYTRYIPLPSWARLHL